MITATFSLSSIPIHRMNSGMNAVTGRYRRKDMTGSKNASIGAYTPIKMPSGTATTMEIRNPSSTRYVVTPMSCTKPFSVKSRMPVCKVSMGFGRNFSLTNPSSVRSSQTRNTSRKEHTAMIK